MSLPKRIGIIVAVGLFVLAAAVVAMFALGKPTITGASPQAVPPEVAETGSPADAGSDPLAIEIPGCVCHSDDPEVVEAHATYRMSECFDCHQGGMPEMGQ